MADAPAIIKHPSPEETLAARIFSELSTKQTVFHEIGPQAADYRIEEGGQQIGLLEVTSVRNEKMLALGSQISKSSQSPISLPGSDLEWNIILVAGSAVKDDLLRVKLPPMLAEIEAKCPQGINIMPFSRDTNWDGTDPITYDLFDLGVGWLVANPSNNPGRIGLSRGTRAMFDSDLPTALESTFDKNNMIKLAAAGDGIKVQFVWVDRHRTAGSEMMALGLNLDSETQPPVRLPRLPAEVTEVWSAIEIKPGEVLVWIADEMKWSVKIWTGDPGVSWRGDAKY